MLMSDSPDDSLEIESHNLTQQRRDSSEGNDDDSVENKQVRTHTIRKNIRFSSKQYIDDKDAAEEFDETELGATGGSRPENTGVKVVFDNLPPSLKEEEFLDFVGELPPHNYFFYKQAMSMGNMEPTCSVIINFIEKKDAGEWMEKLHDELMTDPYGDEYPIIAAIMINQNIPKLNPPVDPLAGTIEETDLWKNFATRYETANGLGLTGEVLNPDGEITADIMLQEIEEKHARAKALQDTPLIEHLRVKLVELQKQAKAAREEAEAKMREAKEKRRQARQERRERKDKERKEEKERLEKLDKKRRKDTARRKANSKSVEPKHGVRVKKDNTDGASLDISTPLSRPKSEGAEPNVRSGPSAAEGSEELKQKTPTKKETPTKRDTPGFSNRGKGKKLDRGSGRSGQETTHSSNKEKESDRDRGSEGRYSKPKNSKPWEKERENISRRGTNRWEKERESNSKIPEDGGNQEPKSDTQDVKSTPKEKESNVSSEPSKETSSGTGNEASATAGVPVPTEGEQPSSSTATNIPDKKKVVKKIIRKVIKVKSTDTGAVGSEHTSNSSSAPKPLNKKVYVKKIEKPLSSEPSTANTTVAPGSTDTATSNNKQSGDEKKDEKRKRNRPDIQIYRPGGWRRNSSGAGGQAQKEVSEKTSTSNSKVTSSEAAQKS